MQGMKFQRRLKSDHQFYEDKHIDENLQPAINQQHLSQKGSMLLKEEGIREFSR